MSKFEKQPKKINGSGDRNKVTFFKATDQKNFPSLASGLSYRVINVPLILSEKHLQKKP